MSSELTEYINNYLTNTLGIQTILADVAKNTSTVIYVENLNSYNASETELLEKMIAALKLNLNDFNLLDLSEKGDYSAQIILKDKPEKPNETYSARVLLRQPELKRKAWDDLKRAFARP